MKWWTMRLRDYVIRRIFLSIPVVIGVLALLGVIDVGVPHHPGSNISVDATPTQILITLALLLPLATIFTVVAVRANIGSRTGDRTGTQQESGRNVP